MAWAKISSVASVLKPTFKLLDSFVMPLLVTALFWTYLDKAVQILAVLVLGTIWLDKLGFNVNVSRRLEKTRFWKLFKLVARSVSPIAKMNEEYFEEAGTMLAEGTKIVAKKIEEEMSMSKLKRWREKSLLFLTFNKKMFTVYIVVFLFAFDMYFEWSQTYGLPPDIWYYVAVVIMFLVLWAAGGEGWTGNTINQARKNAMQTKKDVHVESKKWQAKLDKVNVEIDEIIADKVDGMIPPHLKQRYDDLAKSKSLYTKKLAELLAKLNPSQELE